MTNLKKFCQEYIPKQFKITIIDLLICPEKAKKNDIIAIPTIIKIKPKPTKRFIGNLSNSQKMIEILELPHANDNKK